MVAVAGSTEYGYVDPVPAAAAMDALWPAGYREQFETSMADAE